MTPMEFIIEHVFKSSQRAFSKRLEVAQPTVNGWCEKGYCHYSYQLQIRDLARADGLHWEDRYFFEVPKGET